MAITDYQMNEIKRKAQAGIALDKPTDAKMAIYNQYVQKPVTTQPVQQPKAEPKPKGWAPNQQYINDIKYDPWNDKASYDWADKLYGSGSYYKPPEGAFIGAGTADGRLSSIHTQLYAPGGGWTTANLDDKNRIQELLNKGYSFNPQSGGNSYTPSQNTYQAKPQFNAQQQQYEKAQHAQQNNQAIASMQNVQKLREAMASHGLGGANNSLSGQVHSWGGNVPQTPFYGDPGFSIEGANITRSSVTNSNGLTNYSSAPAQSAPLSYAGINDYQMGEIYRKAIAGEALSSPTQEKQALYDYYRNNPTAKAGAGINDYQMSEIIRKAQAGIPLDSPTAEKMAIYNMFAPQAQSTEVTPFDMSGYVQQYTDQINSMYDSQQQAQLERLRAERDKAIGHINQQKDELAPQYQSIRNQTDAASLQNNRRLNEVMANAGLASSGENVTAQVAQNNQRQSSLNAANLQEQQTLNDFNRRITDLMNPAEENALIAQLQAERARALLDLGMRADEIGYGRTRDSIMDQRYFDERDYDRMWRDREWNYGIGRDRISDERYQTEWDYGVGRDQIADERYDQEWQNRLDQQKLEEVWRQREWNELSPAERAAAQLDYEYYLKKQARSGGGGRSSGGSSGGGSASQSSLSNAYQQFQQQKSKSSSSPVDQYYNAMESIFKPIPRKEPVYPIPSIGSNANLSNYDRLQMIKQQYGIR